MKKILIFSCVIIILLIALLPFPQKINKTYCGVNTQNGETVEITLDMKYLKFLFLKDTLSGTITVKTETETFSYGEFLHYFGQSPSVNNANDNAHDFSGWYYNDTTYMRNYKNGLISPDLVGFESVLVHASSDFDKILILHNKSGKIENQETARYVGCVNSNQVDEAKDYFTGYYD